MCSLFINRAKERILAPPKPATIPAPIKKGAIHSSCIFKVLVQLKLSDVIVFRNLVIMFSVLLAKMI